MGLDDFLSLGGHLLAPFLFHEMTSLHPPSFQRNDAKPHGVFTSIDNANNGSCSCNQTIYNDWNFVEYRVRIH